MNTKNETDELALEIKNIMKLNFWDYVFYISLGILMLWLILGNLGFFDSI